MAETYQRVEEELAKQRKRELEELREEMHRMEVFKSKLDEYEILINGDYTRDYDIERECNGWVEGIYRP